MTKATWQRTLIIAAAQMREEASLNDQLATEREDPEGLRRSARAYREAAHLLDDAEALIAGAHGKSA
jgi:hypothetical protein